MPIRLPSLLCLALLLLAPVHLFGQQIREPDPTPLEAPKPICTLRLADLDTAIQALSKVFTTGGFSLESASDETGQILAKKAQGNGENRVLLWLERDLNKPTERFRVYFAAGRYEPFFGFQNLQRALITDGDFHQRFGSIKAAIIARCAQAH
jgi:hypothetical protein